MKIYVLALLSLFCAASTVHAQPGAAPAPPVQTAEAAPIIEAPALQLITEMSARYAALGSYSDATQLRVTNAAGEPIQGDGWTRELAFEGVLQWQRPAFIRFEGTTAKGHFVALGTDEISRAVVPDYPKFYMAHPRNPPLVMTAADGTQTTLPNTQPIQFEEPLMGNPIPGGPGQGFIFDSDFWKRTQKDVRVLTQDPDVAASAETDGEACRVVRVQFVADTGSTGLMRVFIAKSDGLLRRLEMRDSQMPGNSRIVETHFEVRANPTLPAATWEFEPPADAQAVEYFSLLEPHKYDPDIQIGALLPTFSADGLNGEPIELNPQSGKVTIVHFFSIGNARYSLQTLNKLARTVGPQKLQVIGVSLDGLRPRVAEFVARYKTIFPIYFDPSAVNNLLARKFGIKSWPTTLIFGSDGQLKTLGTGPGEVKFIETIQQLLPGTPDDAFILQDDEFIPAADQP